MRFCANVTTPVTANRTLQPGSNRAMSYSATGVLPVCTKSELRLCGGYAFHSAAGANDAHSPVDSCNDGDAERGTLVTACADRIKIERSGYRLHRATRRYVQTVTLKNDGTVTATGPVTYLLFSLSAKRRARAHGRGHPVKERSMKRMRVAHFVSGMLAVACLLMAPAAHALLFTIEVDTAPLIGHPAGPFSLEFQLNDGSGTSDGNNTALIGPFDFHGGSEVGAPTLIGGASGDLGSHVVLADEQSRNEFFQEFDPGPLLTFDVDLSQSVDPGPQPDQFSFAILDCNLIEIPTGGPADALVLVDIANPPRVRAFNGDVSRASDCGGIPISIRVLEPPPEVAGAANGRPAGRCAERAGDRVDLRRAASPTKHLKAIVVNVSRRPRTATFRLRVAGRCATRVLLQPRRPKRAGLPARGTRAAWRSFASL